MADKKQEMSKKQAARKKLQELNLIDNFLFGTMFTTEEVAEDFGRILLKIIFQKEFTKLTVVPQRVIYGSDTIYHGARLDVYIEGEEGTCETSTIYDLEPEKKSDKKKSLPQRVRFYYSRSDAKCLKSGEDYSKLKQVAVVMIMPFDPFGYDRMIYTIRNHCVEVPKMPYDDGAVTLFLYTKGKKGNVPEQLRQLLHYMEQTTSENAVTPELQSLDHMVQNVKHKEEVSGMLLDLMADYREDEDALIERGRAEGYAQMIHTFVANSLKENNSSEQIITNLQRYFNLNEETARGYLNS